MSARASPASAAASRTASHAKLVALLPYSAPISVRPNPAITGRLPARKLTEANLPRSGLREQLQATPVGARSYAHARHSSRSVQLRRLELPEAGEALHWSCRHGKETTNRVSGVLALLFPGQGSQRPKMGTPWKDHPAWRVVEMLSEAAGRDIAHLLLDADADTLKATRNAQMATFAVSLVILRAARATGLEYRPVRAIAGHSLGEYTALVAAEALEPTEAAQLVAARGQAMQEAADARTGTMAAVLGLDPELVAKACEDVGEAWPANDNAPGQVVIAGTLEGVRAAGELAKQLGAKRVMPLAVGGAFHSPLMEPARPRLDKALSSARFNPAVVDVVANVDAALHRDGWPELLSRQLTSPVRWRESLLTLQQAGVTHFLELGPGNELSGMVKRTLAGASRANVAVPEDLDALVEFLESSS